MARLKIHWWAAACLVSIGAAVFAQDAYAVSLIKLVAIAALIAGCLRFVMLMGELNFATAAFVGLGAYGAGVATTILQWPLWAALLAGVVMPTIVSVPFGLVTLRTKGHYFLLTSFAFTETVRIVLSKCDAVGGNSGMVGIFPPRFMDPWMPAVTVSLASILLFALYFLEKSDFGKVLVGIRDNENVLKTVGINVLLRKVACLAIASFCGGMAGALQAFANNVISPGDFSYLIAASALAAVKVGGESSIAGAISGALLLAVLGSFALGFGAGQDALYGAVIVIVVLLMPKGVIGLFSRSTRSGTSLEQESGPAKLAKKLNRGGAR